MIEDWFEGKKHFCRTLCEGCKREFVQRFRSNPKWLRRFCSLSCINLGRKHTKEWKEKMSERNSGSSNPFFGKTHDEETRLLMSQKSQFWHDHAPLDEKMNWRNSIATSVAGFGNPFFGKKHSEKSCSRMSLTRSLGISEGRIGAQRGIKGLYESSKMDHKMRYDSFYEFVRMQMLDDDNEVISWTKNHGIRIAYEFNGERKTYVPDFLISYDSKIVLEEIKGYELYEKKIAKYKALEEYAKHAGIECRILEFDQLDELAKICLGKTISQLRSEFKCRNVV